MHIKAIFNLDNFELFSISLSRNKLPSSTSPPVMQMSLCSNYAENYNLSLQTHTFHLILCIANLETSQNCRLSDRSGFMTHIAFWVFYRNTYVSLLFVYRPTCCIVAANFQLVRNSSNYYYIMVCKHNLLKQLPPFGLL